jgi:hypothetical protein
MAGTAARTTSTTRERAVLTGRIDQLCSLIRHLGTAATQANIG